MIRYADPRRQPHGGVVGAAQPQRVADLQEPLEPPEGQARHDDVPVLALDLHEIDVEAERQQRDQEPLEVCCAPQVVEGLLGCSGVCEVHVIPPVSI